MTPVAEPHASGPGATTPSSASVLTDPEKPVPGAEDVPNEKKLDEAPDGGLVAWLAVLGGFCTIFASFGWINCMQIPL